MGHHHRFVTVAVVSAALFHSPVAAQSVPQVIVETDIGGDTDDAAMIAFAHRLADQGKIQLLAVMHNGNNEWGGSAISAINTYYGRPTLPIGTYRTAAEAGRPEYDPWIDPANPALGRQPLAYTGPTLEGRWVRLLAENFPCHYMRRLDFPDAVDVYEQVLGYADDNRVVIINGGFLGNLSNLFAWFDADPELGALFAAKVNRMTGAVGGVNTCVNGVFPAGLARHVLENPHHPTACGTSLGLPIIDIVATQTTAELATEMALDHPVREAYRYKSEVEHGNRHTANHWHWHIIDILTSFSVLAWDEWDAPAGHPWFDIGPVGWLDVAHNCGATIQFSTPPAPHMAFREAGAHVPAGQTVFDISAAMKQRFFDDGLYPDPVDKWSPEREHRSVTALFEDGTFGGLDFNGGNGDTQVIEGWLIAPVSTNLEYSGATLIAESRRFFDQTLVTRVDAVPPVQQFATDVSGPAHVDFYFWGDGRYDTTWGSAPLVRITSWPGREPGDPGRPVYACSVWEPQASGFVRIATVDLDEPIVGQPFTLRVEVEGSTVQVAVDGALAFDAPVQLSAAPPSDGGLSQLRMHSVCPAGGFALDYVLLRPEAGPQTKVDVHFDKRGTTWFSYVKNGDLQQEFATAVDSGAVGHFVDIVFVERPWTDAEIPIRLDWLDENPAFVDWIDLVSIATWEGVGSDHWIYGLHIPWMIGDEVVLEYAGRREGEQVPISVPVF